MIQLPKMSKRVLLSRTLLLLWASTSNDITASGVQLAGDRGDHDGRPLNILFLTQGSTELKAAHAGMKWLAEQTVDGTTTGPKKFNVAYLFAASTKIKTSNGVDMLAEESAEESGWLLTAAPGAGEGEEAQNGVHPLNANDVPRGLPAFGDLPVLPGHELVPKNWPQWKKGTRFDQKRDQIIQKMQPPSKDLIMLKRAGVHLIPYRLFGPAPKGENVDPQARHLLSPAPYVEYLKNTIFNSGEIDLLVSDILVYTDEKPNNVFDGAFEQDMRNQFFPQLNAKKVVRWSGNQDAVNEVAAAAFGNVQEGKLPKSPVISATPFPMLTAPSFREPQTKKKHDSLGNVPLYFPKNVDGVEVGPIGLVMQHPAGETVENDKKVDSDTVQKIRKRLHREDDLSLDGLIFVAFGTQGNGFSKEGVRFLVRELVNASPTNLVYLVRPKLLPDQEGGQPVSAEASDAFFRSLEADASAQGRLLVHETDNAPQQEILQAFAPGGRHNAKGQLKFSFLTHGGAGSLSEALGLGVPVLCLPLLNTDKEQADNCERLALQGMGRDLGKLTMVMSFRDFVAPIVHASPDGNKGQWIRSVLVRHATEGSTPGHDMQRPNGEPDRRKELQDLDDVSTHHQKVLRTFYERAASFRAPAGEKLAEDGAKMQRAQQAAETEGAAFDFASFVTKKQKEWLSKAQLHFSIEQEGAFPGDGVLEAEAALLSASTKMRQKILENLRANLEKVKINTLNRDVDVGPLLAKFAENPVPPSDGWKPMEEVDRALTARMAALRLHDCGSWHCGSWPMGVALAAQPDYRR
mmetsp:Transcript_25382/g.63895  ORF Transcript_25382/g.63895 Transcript_25382/m.63895 type:complete len:802 (-) Transcript_25382:609-3014(-)